MKTVELVEEAGADKLVRVAIPVEEAARRYRLIVLIEPEFAPSNGDGLDNWPEGFIESMAGKWIGDFERPPQGEFSPRYSL